MIINHTAKNIPFINAVEFGELIEVEPGYLIPSEVIIYGNIPSEHLYLFGATKVRFKGTPPEHIPGWFGIECAFTELTLPEGVVSIGSQAFAYCLDLTEVSLPSTLTYIDSEAFGNCPIEILNIKSVDTTPANPLGGTIDALTTINFLSGSTCVPEALAEAADLLTTINWVDTIVAIGFAAFTGCISLNSLNLPAGLMYIGEEAFAGCTGLTSVEIPEGTECLDRVSFAGCTSLTEVSLPSTLEEMYDGAFASCTALTSLWIPASCTTISFSEVPLCAGCSSGLVIYCEAESKPTGWSEYWNYYEEGLALEVMWGVSREAYNNMLLGIYTFPSSLTSITSSDIPSNIASFHTVIIPEGVTSIDTEAFKGITTLEEVQLPSTLTSIGVGAFGDCTNLVTINLPDGVAIYDEAFNDCENLPLTSLPNGVTLIITSSGEHFYRCDALAITEIPASVTAIPYSGFKSCIGIPYLALSSGITSIKFAAFQGCVFSRIWIPATVTEIGTGGAPWNAPFVYCPETVEIYCEAESKPAGWDTYWNCYDYYGESELTVHWGVSRATFDAL